MGKVAGNVSIIGGADGPTSIFIAGKGGNVKTVKGVKIITTMEGYKDLLIYPPSALLEGDDEHDDD